MLRLSNVSFTLEGRRLIEGATVTIPTGHKVGVVGRNGTGKTTLFKLIRGEWLPEAGDIEMPRGWRIGGVAQEAPASEATLLETVLAADTERSALLAEAETATDPLRIADIQARLTDIGAHSAVARAATILAGLGFDAAAQARPCHEFSGGWRMRVALAAVLFSQPDLLLLDEPTNYLDLEGAVWLENFLARYPHTALIISHDRGLLNRAVDGILHLSQATLTYYSGNYDSFDSQRRAQLDQQLAAKKKQEAARAHIMAFVDRFRATASKARQAQSRLKMLERMQPIAVSVEGSVAPFRFPEPAALPPPLLTTEGVSIGYDGRVVLGRLDLRIDPDDRIALLGANGQGKSTLTKLLAGKLAPMQGRVVKSSKMKVGYFAQHQLDELVPGENAIQHIQRLLPDEPQAKLRARLGAAGIGSEIAEHPVERLSGGQKARLLMCLAALDAPNLLLLDEPTNHLDMESREQLVMALNTYPGAVILVTHDAHLVEAVADRLWLVADGRVRSFDGDMEDYKRLLLSQRATSSEPAKVPTAKPAAVKAPDHRKTVAMLKAEVSRAEAIVTKLEAMRAEIDRRLADPALYEGSSDKIEALSIKRAEVMEGLARAEAMWMEALTRLEAAQT